jgi:hypothetical protein
MEYPSFEDLAEVVRRWARLKRDRRIDPGTEFERDLAISVHDETDLLNETERHYGIKFTAESFDLKPNEYLFHSSSPDTSPLIQTIFEKTGPVVRTFTVGQLYRAVLRELSRSRDIPADPSS